MQPFLATYRWELWLLLGIPAIAVVTNYAYALSPILEESYSGGFFLWHIIRHAVAALLLGAAYSRVRGLGRPLLFLFWRYSLTVAVVSAVGYLLLWFARQASRISLAHAFLLVALTVGGNFPRVRSLDYLDSPFGIAILSADAIGLASVLVAVWALAHFDGLSRGVRTCSIVALFALSGLRPAALAGIGIVPLTAQENYMDAAAVGFGFFLPIAFIHGLTLGLTYLIRVRPQPEQEPETKPAS